MADLPASATSMMDLAHSLTVCICTRDRPHALEAALHSVSENAPAASIVVSDDGDGSAAAVAAGNARCRWQQGPRRGLGANRNAAVDAVETDWLLFLDDDARLGEEFVPAMERALCGLDRNLRERTILTGRELNRGRLVPPHDVDFLGFQQRDYAAGEALHTVVINAAVWPRSLFASVRFDEQLRYGSDEVDLAYSALAAGHHIEFCPSAVNHHDPDPHGREGYAESAHVSRLRATTKRHWRLQERRGKAIVFVLVAPCHLALALVKRQGMSGIAAWARVMRRWLRPA
jgi:glycosyltransferase involved in cell wall biosynthesis